MSLILTVKSGERIYVGDQHLEILTVEPTPNVKVRRSDGVIFMITEEHGKEVLPEVEIALSRAPGGAKARLRITAPPTKVILRRTLYGEKIVSS